MQTVNDPKIIVALDFASEASAFALVDRLDPAKCRLKVGKELFTRFGPQLVRSLQGLQREIKSNVTVNIIHMLIVLLFVHIIGIIKQNLFCFLKY